MKFVDRLLRDFLTEDGSLLVCEYRSSRDIHDPCIDDTLRGYDLNVIACKSAVYEGKELTRVAQLKQPIDAKALRTAEQDKIIPYEI